MFCLRHFGKALAAAAAEAAVAKWNERSEKRMDGMKDELPFTNSPSHSLSAALAGCVKARGGGTNVVGTDSATLDKARSPYSLHHRISYCLPLLKF